ncbi:MAG: hypothetical protein HY291_23370 [Planctomycetes bacterium]|nr:hypothetical protein [Planctomycetota bacterium]
MDAIKDLIRSVLQHSPGILTLVCSLLLFLICFHYVLWLLRRGRFKDSNQKSQNQPTIAYALSVFVGKIITDFRHALALSIVLLFAIIMFLVIAAGWDDFEKVKAGIQLVSASLGGLIGSIIGYYFGESAGRREGVSGQGQIPSQTAGQSSGVTPVTEQLPVESSSSSSNSE